MRNGIFVEGLSNVARFLDGTRALDARGAPEACWQLLQGDPGYGKSGTLTWYANKKKAAFLRAKADWTPHWMLSDLADVLNVQKRHSTEGLFNVVMPELMVRHAESGLFLIVDEINHAARNIRVLETLRDLTDAAEMPLIAGGTRDALPMMSRFKQLTSRIADVVTFHPATVADVKAICAELSEVKVADDLAAEVQKCTGGRLREVKTAIGRIEHAFRRERGVVKLEDWKASKRALTNGDRVPLQVVASA
jgi:hypothetical protein